SLSTLLREVAQRSPDRAALVADGARIDYAALDVLAARAAGGLHERGVRRGDRVALLLPNRPAFVAAYHGALRLGAVVVPLNTLSTEREVGERVADAGARILVDEELAGPALDGIEHVDAGDV